MNKICFVTSNPGKAESFNAILGKTKFDFEFEILNAEYPEDKSSETTQGVVLAGAKYCAEKYQKPVLVSDSGLFIEALYGFPGVNTKFTLVRIANDGILKLLEGQKNRKAAWILSIGYCEPNGESAEFTGVAQGEISQVSRGDKGFGFDPIFMLKGHSVTCGENPEARDAASPFNAAIRQFAAWDAKTRTH